MVRLQQLCHLIDKEAIRMLAQIHACLGSCCSPAPSVLLSDVKDGLFDLRFPGMEMVVVTKHLKCHGVERKVGVLLALKKFGVPKILLLDHARVTLQ